MTDSPYQQMARQFVDMWQEQSQAMMQDERFLDTMLEMFRSMPQPGASGDAAASADAAAASGDGGDGMERLARRVELLERRIAELERQLARQRGESVS